MEAIAELAGLSRLSCGELVMFVIAGALLYLGIVRKHEPLLLVPIGFGMLLTNLPGTGLMEPGGLLHTLYQGVAVGFYPPLIFIGIGALTDFGPLLANPKAVFLGAAAQVGIFLTFLGALALGFDARQAASVAIIGGADGPTAIFLTGKLSPELLAVVAIAAYSYMALLPLIQPPVMRLLTSSAERGRSMPQLREVGRGERLFFPVAVTLLGSLLVPSAAPLLGALMLGNLLRESGVTKRLASAAGHELLNVVTLFLGLSVGASATAEIFLTFQTLLVIVMGLLAFVIGTASGVLFGKLMALFDGGRTNPLIGAAGVSAVPIAARVVHNVGQEENPEAYLLMQAMGPNVSGVIGSAIAAGVFLSVMGC